MVPSKDEGNINGYVHSHRFPGANTAVPTANEDPAQLERARNFCRTSSSRVDIFAVSPAGKKRNCDSRGIRLQARNFPPLSPSAKKRTLLLRKARRAKRGPSLRRSAAWMPPCVAATMCCVDVVVRTRKVGHFFPGGTVDAFDVWLELQATDEKGQMLFWSGKVEDDGKGPVEPGAHFYKSLQIDAHGNAINKRNAWANRAVVYVHLIPPGAADTAHFRLHIPENAGDKINLHAKLNYRKFMWWNTQFSFAGEEDPSQPQRRDHSGLRRPQIGCSTATLSGVAGRAEENSRTCRSSRSRKIPKRLRVLRAESSLRPLPRQSL